MGGHLTGHYYPPHPVHQIWLCRERGCFDLKVVQVGWVGTRERLTKKDTNEIIKGEQAVATAGSAVCV